ncbi:MAG: Coenzyme F420 hydrogenase/dehydrogenase, beta subunit C-terminal domain [Lachnospiraceae bacterium]|nr:Coenzyme F420 hydrogenase/dehydrogenase, beta subunit C-terminal domain [Lachnospiraceae bacterium]
MIQVLPDKKQDCCGCSACAQICPKDCIAMTEDNEGFAYPEIDTNKCIGCNLCEKTCPIIVKKNINEQNKEYAEHFPKAVGGWHKNEAVRFESSSGGAFTLFAEHIIRQGGIVYGAALNEELHTEHIGVERIEDLIKLKGSKYVQSDIAGVYKEIKEQLINSRKVLFTGAPCQCAGLHSFLHSDESFNKDASRYDNLYTCDFICHGVPSPKVFRSYINYLEAKYHDKVVSFRFRNKDKGWNPTGFQMGTDIGFKNIGNKRFVPALRDAYMNGFLDDVYLRPSCYNCEFKSLPKYYADITIADFWGVKKVDPELYDGKGTSLVLLHNEHAKELFDRVKSNFFYKEVDFKAAIHKNKSLLKSSDENPHRDSFFLDYESLPFDKVRKKYMGALTWASHRIMKKAWKCIEKLIKIVFKPVLGLFHIKWGNSEWDSFFQFVKFAMVGVSNSAVSYTINITMLFFLRDAMLTYDYIIANITAFALSVLWSYHWNSRYVFHPDRNKKGWRMKILVKTYISYAVTGIVLNNLLATLWIRGLGISKYLSPLLNLPFSIPTNFFMHKLWAYREGRINNNK